MVVVDIGVIRDWPGGFWHPKLRICVNVQDDSLIRSRNEMNGRSLFNNKD